jgi:general secretion pathway protein I
MNRSIACLRPLASFQDRPLNRIVRSKPANSGFTLLEVLVATVILAVAISGLMSALSGSLRVAGRLTDYDRAAMLARRKMEEIVADKRAPRFVTLEGAYDPAQTNGAPSGWKVRITPFEMPPNPTPGIPIVDRIEVQVWWMNGESARTFGVEGFRRHYLTPQDVAAGLNR